MKRKALVVMFLMAGGAIGLAEESCPWLNAATAGGVLGGEVTSHVNRRSGDTGDAACTFELRRNKAFSQLTIDVITMRVPQVEYTTYTAQCGSTGTPLKAMGNEAVGCGGTNQGDPWQAVIGRVRDRAFIVRISTNEASARTEQLRSKAEKTAEQVAGFLF